MATTVRLWAKRRLEKRWLRALTAPGPSPARWVSLVAAGALLTTAAAYRMRRMRSIARHAR